MKVVKTMRNRKGKLQNKGVKNVGLVDSGDESVDPAPEPVLPDFSYPSLKAGKKYSNNFQNCFEVVTVLAKECCCKPNEEFARSKRFCALAFHGNRLLAFGINKMKTPGKKYIDYPNNEKYSTHAEIGLLIKLIKENIVDEVTDVIVVRAFEKFYESKPCPLCLAHLSDVFGGKGVRLHFLTTNGWEKVVL